VVGGGEDKGGTLSSCQVGNPDVGVCGEINNSNKNINANFKQ